MNAHQNGRPQKGQLERANFCADTNQQSAKYIADKATATVRAKLCHAGGQVLHVANDGAFFITTPFGQITRFDSVESLQACVDRFEK